jgi:hypothetical protein
MRHDPRLRAAGAHRRFHRRSLQLAIVLTVSVLAHGWVAAEEEESTQSHPKDLTPYARETELDEDRAPKPFNPQILLVDTVVSNTDPTLTLTDTFNDGETSIAVNPRNPDEIIITAFSGAWGPNAPLWHSTDGGVTWTKEFTITPPPGRPSAPCPCDQTIDYGRQGPLFGTFLVDEVYTGATTDPTSAAAWNWFAPGGVTQATNFNALAFPDQPWLLVNLASGHNSRHHRHEKVYVAYDDFAGAPDMRVAVASAENPANFTVDNRSGFSTRGVNPGHRLAVDPNTGFVYSLFQRCMANCGGDPKSIDYMLNRSTDNGATWGLNGNATGIVVANANSTQPRPKFGTVNALLGGVLHAAVDPQTADVYYVYGRRDTATGNNRLAIRRIVDDGASGARIGGESFVTGQVPAALPSVAVARNGTIGVFYYSFDGFSSGGFPIFSAHLAASNDHGLTFTDTLMLTFLSSAKDNGNPRQRVLGDYVQMKTIPEQRDEEDECVAIFYGAFTANGVPFGRPFANHDPVFFRVSLRKGNGEDCSNEPDQPDRREQADAGHERCRDQRLGVDAPGRGAERCDRSSSREDG